ncbi:SRPBCC family protein [Kitasatospora sp. MBT63]|uniref:SRPBCC family protein n=1 Tax=Kitasatospora sp. MBT63 TaxID=1444768 RepID=UPI00053ABD05|nr:SRPBCC family protein [Kitasatospora sp. MBT63]
MSRTEESIEVAAPVGAVYEQWCRVSAFPRFMSGVEEVVPGPGGTVHWVARVDGVQREFDAEITERIAGERIAWRSVDGAEQSGVVTFHDLGAGRTRIMLQLDHTPHGVIDLIGDRLGFVAHQVHRCLQEFKEHVERRSRAA